MSVRMLDEFCHGLMDDEAPRERLRPNDMARQFVDFFGLSAFPRMDEIASLLERAGVGTAVCSRLPEGLRGIHTGTKNGHYLIEYDARRLEGRAGAHCIPRDLRDRQEAASGTSIPR